MNLPWVMQIGLAGLVDQLRDLAHRLVHRQVLQLHVDDEAEEQSQHADDESEHQQGAAPHPGHVDRAEVGDLEVGLAARCRVRRNRRTPRSARG